MADFSTFSLTAEVGMQNTAVIIAVKRVMSSRVMRASLLIVFMLYPFLYP